MTDSLAFTDTDLSFALQWEEAAFEQVCRVLVREVYPVAYRLCLDVLGSAARAEAAALRGLLDAARARGEFAGQAEAKAWVLGFVETEALAVARQWGLKRRLAHRAFENAERFEHGLGSLDAERTGELTRRLGEMAASTPPAERRRFGERGWIAGLAAAVLIAVLRFNLGAGGETGEGLFPTSPPPTATVVVLDRAALPYNGESVGWNLETIEFFRESGSAFQLAGTYPPFSPAESQARELANLGSVNALAVSHDSAFAATRVHDEVLIWSLPDAAYMYAFQIETRASPIQFANRSNLLATAGPETGSVRIWSVERSQTRLLYTLESQDGNLAALAFSPDDRFLYVGTDFGIWTWELTGSGAAVLVGHTWYRNVKALAVSPDGSAIAAVGLMGIVDIWSTSDGGTLFRLGGHVPWATRIAFLDGGDRLAVGDLNMNHLIWVLDAENPHVDAVFRNPSGGTENLAVSPDSRYLAVSNSGTIVVWDRTAAPGAPAAFALEHNYAGSIAFTPDGQTLVMAGRDAHLYVFRSTENAPPIGTGTTALPASSNEFVFFLPQSYDEFPSQQVLLIEDGEVVEPNAPFEVFYSLSTREFSTSTGVYTPIPENLPEDAIFLGQRNTGGWLVSVMYELPGYAYQTVVLTIHLSTGEGGAALTAEDFPDRRTGASAAISSVLLSLDGVSGEVAIGGWVFTELDAAAISTDKAWIVVEGQTRWIGTPDRMILRWEQGGMLFELAVTPVDGPTPFGADLLLMDELIAVARDLIDRISD